MRLDVVNFYFHKQSLEDNPAVPEEARRMEGSSNNNPYEYQRHIHDITQPQNLAFLREMRALLNEYPGRTSVGEISADDEIEVMADYTSGNDKIHMAYTFDLLSDTWHPDFLRSVIRNVESRIRDGWPCWALSNHDVTRCATRWGRNEDPAAFPRVALAMLLALRGSVSLYQGDELGLPEADVPRNKIRDPYGLPFWPVYKGRDGCRTPMVWRATADGGFSTGEPWLPVDERQLPLAVETQEQQPDSILHAARALIGWRRQQPALVTGDLQIIENTGEMLCWLRRSPSQQMLVALNMTGQTLRSPLSHRVTELPQGHGFSGRVEDGDIVLEPYQALFACIDAESRSGGE